MSSTLLVRPGGRSQDSVHLIITLLKTVLVTAAVIVLLALGISVLLPRLVGWQVYVVTSGSMAPTIRPGALVIDRPADASQLQPGDVITFHKDGSSELVTHRVTLVVNAADGLAFKTKGDHNPSQDPGRVPAKAVVGRVAFAAPKMGYLVNRLATPWGAGAAAALVGVALLAPSRKKKPVPAEDGTP